VVVCCDCDDKPSGPGAADLVSYNEIKFIGMGITLVFITTRISTSE